MRSFISIESGASRGRSNIGVIFRGEENKKEVEALTSFGEIALLCPIFGSFWWYYI